MGVVHFLNVNEGDCSWIQHYSGYNTIIDISAGNLPISNDKSGLLESYMQKNNPVNPIDYLKSCGVKEIFRFILTHPDMDHMDGIKALFNNFVVSNFWDTENNKVIDKNTGFGKYNEEDWNFYQELRKNSVGLGVKLLHLYSNSKGEYYNRDENNNHNGGDGLNILAPTQVLVAEANKTGTYNDCSYVILYCSDGMKIIFAGDSEQKTWDYILQNYSELVSNVDILLAPHHGRKTGGNDDYLDVLKPKLTLFGNAKSEYLDYNSWNNRKLIYITNNQAGNIIIDTSTRSIYVTNEEFAKSKNGQFAFKSQMFDAWYLTTI